MSEEGTTPGVSDVVFLRFAAEEQRLVVVVVVVIAAGRNTSLAAGPS